MRKRTKRGLLIGLVLIIGGGIGYGAWLRSRKGARVNLHRFGGQTAAEAEVTLAPVALTPVEERISESAEVHPIRLHEVTAEVAGRVITAAFEVGRAVTIDLEVPLVRLDDRDARLSKAEADHALAQAQLTLVRSERDLVRARTMSGLMARERQDQLRQVQADLTKAQADLARQKELMGKSIASEKDLLDAQARERSLTAAEALARTRVELERERQAQALVLSQYALDAAKLTVQVATDKQARAKLALDRTRITAPAAGVVVAKMVEVGSRVSAGTVVARIAVIDHVLLEVGLTEVELQRVRAGVDGRSLALHCRAPAAGWVEPRTLKLTESRLVPMAGRTRTYAAWFAVANDGGRLIPGMTVRLDIATGVRREVLAIPRRSIREVHGKPYVFVERDGVAHLVPIAVVRYAEGKVEVSGIEPGARLIVEGPPTLRDGDAVKSKAAGGRRGGKPAGVSRGERDGSPSAHKGSGGGA